MNSNQNNRIMNYMKTNNCKKSSSKSYSKTHSDFFKDNCQTVMHTYEWLNNNNHKWQLQKNCLDPKCDLEPTFRSVIHQSQIKSH